MMVNLFCSKSSFLRKNRLLIKALGLSLAIGQNVAADKCRIHFEELPLCDSKNKLVNKSLPAQVMYIPDLSPENILIVLDALKGTHTRLQIDNLQELQQKFHKNLTKKNALAKAIQDHQILSRQLDLSKNQLWMNPGDSQFGRDGSIYTYDEEAKKIVLLVSHNEKSVPNSETFCGVPVETKRLPALSPDVDFNSVRGGNILSLPGGSCLTSLDAPSFFPELVCGKQSPVVRIDTQKTRVGHIDELVNILPNSKNSCGFSIVMGSTSKALQILQKSENNFFFSKEGFDRLQKMQNSVCLSDIFMTKASSCYKIMDICKDLEKVKYFQRLQNYIRQSQSRRTQPIKAHQPASTLDLNLSSKEILLSQDLRKDVLKNWSCHMTTNKDMLSLLKADEEFQELQQWFLQKQKFLEATTSCDQCLDHIEDKSISEQKSFFQQMKTELENLIQVAQQNKIYQKIQELNWKTIVQSLPKNCQEDSLRIDLPTIFWENHSLNPNPTNLIIAGTSAVIPWQFNTSFTEEISQTMKNVGVRAVFENTLSWHQRGGNIHCRSNEIRLCRTK